MGSWVSRGEGKPLENREVRASGGALPSTIMPVTNRSFLLPLLAAAALAGCGGSAPVATRAIDVFWPAPDSGAISPHRIQVPVDEPLAGAILAVAENGGLPSGTTLQGIVVAGKTATVELSGAFVTGYPSGGAAIETAMIASLARTVFQETKTTGVLIRVNGKSPDPTGSQFDFTQPIMERDLVQSVGE